MPKVTFAKTDHSLSLDKGEKLTQLDLQANNALPFGCRNALCGTCAIKVEVGLENLSQMQENEKELLDALGINDNEHRLGCQCSIQGDITIIPLNG